MVARNDITGDKIQTKGLLSKKGEEAFDRIFGTKKKGSFFPDPAQVAEAITKLPVAEPGEWGDTEAERRIDVIGSNGNVGYEVEEK